MEWGIYVGVISRTRYGLITLDETLICGPHTQGITGSDGAYNREHRLMCQKPFMNSFSLEQFSRTVESRAALLLDAWEKAAAGPHTLQYSTPSTTTFSSARLAAADVFLPTWNRHASYPPLRDSS